MFKFKLIQNYEVLPVTRQKYDQEKKNPLMIAFPGNSESSWLLL